MCSLILYHTSRSLSNLPYHTESDESNGIDCKIRRHVDKPRGINIAELIVQRIEDQPADNQSEHQQNQHSRMEHTNEHPHMIKGKQYRTVEIGDFHVHILFQRDESESAEEELLKERIHNGDIDRHPEKLSAVIPISDVRLAVTLLKSMMPRRVKYPPRITAKMAVPSRKEMSSPFFRNRNSALNSLHSSRRTQSRSWEVQEKTESLWGFLKNTAAVRLHQ